MDTFYLEFGNSWCFNPKNATARFPTKTKKGEHIQPSNHPSSSSSCPVQGCKTAGAYTSWH